METIKIRSLNIVASKIGLGTWPICGWMWGGADENESIKTIHTALEKGINIIDTAPIYGFGASEKIVGKALKGYDREKVILATKTGIRWDENGIYRDSSAVEISDKLNDSLKRLQTDYIDIYQIHWPDPKTPWEETAEAMLRLFKQGKIRAIGVSNFSVSQIEEFGKIAPIQTSQPPCNLFEQEALKTVIPYTEKIGIVSLCYCSLCRGLLSGEMRVNKKFKGDDLRNIDPKYKKPVFLQYLMAAAELNKFARQNYGKSLLALAIRWVLDQGHTIALWGARHPEQLKKVEEIMGWSLDNAAMKKINEIVNRHIVHPIGTEFLAPPEPTTKASVKLAK